VPSYFSMFINGLPSVPARCFYPRSFISQYPPDDPRIASNIPPAGPLDVGVHHEIHTVFLPAVLKDYSDWWPQSVP
jgi:hypothetical protein